MGSIRVVDIIDEWKAADKIALAGKSFQQVIDIVGNAYLNESNNVSGMANGSGNGNAVSNRR